MGKKIMERISIMSYPYCHYSFEYFLNSMEKFNVKNIELWGGSPHIYFEDFSREKANDIKGRVASSGMKISAYTPEQVLYPYNIAAREPEIRKRSLDYFIKNIGIAAQIGSPIILVSAGWGYLDESREAAFDRSIGSMKTLAHIAQENGVMLALEALTKISSNLVNHASELADMVSAVSSTSLAGMLDVGQMAILGETVSDYFKALGKAPVYMHIMDGRPAGHLAFGDGILPVDKYIKEALDLGYQGIFSMEMNDRQYYLDPDRAISSSLAILQGWLTD